MGKKLKPQPKLVSSNKKSTPKNIFDTGDKTLGPATTAANAINKRLLDALNKTNIPVLMEFGNSKNALNLFFMNRDLITFVMGDHQRIMDRVFKDVLAEYVAEEVLELVQEQRIPGHWSIHGLMALCRRMVNIITLADKPELGAYLSAHDVDPEDPVVTYDMVKEYPAMTCMRFTDFNPNRLYQFTVVLRETAMKMIMVDVSSTLPVANLIDMSTVKGKITGSSINKAISLRYGNEFAKYGSDRFVKWFDENAEREDMTLDAKMKGLSKIVADEVMGYAYRVLQTTGVSDQAIDTVFNICSPKVSYALNNMKSMVEIAANRAELVIFFKPTETTLSRGPAARIVLPFADVYRVMVIPNDTDVHNIGYLIRLFVLQLMNMCIMAYEPRKNFGIPDGEEESNEPVGEEEKIDLGAEVSEALEGVSED